MSSNSGLEYLNTHVMPYKLIEQEVYGEMSTNANSSCTERNLKSTGWIIIVLIITHFFMSWSPLKCAHNKFNFVLFLYFCAGNIGQFFLKQAD